MDAPLGFFVPDGLVHVQHVMHGFVTDGMDRRWESCAARGADQLVDLLFVEYGDTPVVRFAVVRIDHQRGTWAKSAIGKELHATQTQPVVTKPPAQPQL